MNYSQYTIQRLLTAFNPIAHLQRAPYSARITPITFTTADQVAIGGTLFRRGRDKLIILCHGFMGGQRSSALVWLAEQLAERYDVLTFDWRGYGLSEGHASLGGAEALDLAAALELARELGYQRIGVTAESMGGLIMLSTLGAAAADPAFPMPHSIAALAPPADYALTAGLRPQLVKYLAPVRWLRPLAPLLGFRLGEVRLPRPLDVVANIHLPLLLIHGDKDTVVPVRNAHLLHEQNPAIHLEIYPGVDHAIIGMMLRSPRRLVADLYAHFDAM